MGSGMSGQAPSHAPDATFIEALARDALARIPEPFATHLADVVLLVEEFADDETLDAMGIEDPFDLTGLYHGRPVGEKSAFDSGGLPDRIHLYRRAILDYWCEGTDDLRAVIRHVLIHEIGHHFGFSDADMHRIERTGTD